MNVARGGGVREGRKGFDREHVTERDFLEGLGVDKRGLHLNGRAKINVRPSFRI